MFFKDINLIFFFVLAQPYGWKPNEPAANMPSPGSGGFIDPENLEPKNFSFNEASVRKGFLRKVYLILMVSTTSKS